MENAADLALQTLTGTISGSIVKNSLSDLNADLAHGADTMAWVVGDSTQGNDGVYQKQGASGAGSWTRLADLPYNVIQLNNANAGTANAIQATTAVNVPDAAYGSLLVLNITAANTGAVTLSVNSETARPVVTNTNAAIVSGYFVVGMAVLCVDDGTSYRLMSYGDASAVQAAAEAAQAAAEAAASSVLSSSAFASSFAKTPAADGSTDDVAALIALEAGAEEVIRLKNATYFIGTDYTPAKTLKFSSDTRFLIDDGVTVDFSNYEPIIQANKKQKFDFDGTGTGAVIGLDNVCLGWFAGDKLNHASNTIDDELEKAVAALSSNGSLKLNRGDYRYTGASAVTITAPQSVIGFGKTASRFIITTAVTNLFETAGGWNAKFYGFSVIASNELTATSGNAIDINSGHTTVEHVETYGCYISFACNENSGGSSFRHVRSYDAIVSSLYLETTLEIIVDDFVFAAPFDIYDVTPLSGTFSQGETVTDTSGNQAVLGQIVTSNKLRLKSTYDDIQISETITGATSGATATVTARTYTHLLGAIRLYGFVEGCLFTNGDVIGGRTSMATDTASDTLSNRPAYNKFTNIFFDSSDLGVYLRKCKNFVFSNCWFSCRPGPGIDAEEAEFCLIGGEARHCGAQGVIVRSNAVCRSSGFVSKGNNVMDNGSAAIQVNSGGEFHASNGDFGGVDEFVNINSVEANTPYSISVASGGVAYVNGVDLSGSATGAVSDSSTSSQIKNCKGYVNEKRGSVVVNSDGSGLGTIAHGLVDTPVYWATSVTGDVSVECIVLSADATNLNVKLRQGTTAAALANGAVTVRFESSTQNAIN
jgi:hypothetical protein